MNFETANSHRVSICICSVYNLTRAPFNAVLSQAAAAEYEDEYDDEYGGYYGDTHERCGLDCCPSCIRNHECGFDPGA